MDYYELKNILNWKLKEKSVRSSIGATLTVSSAEIERRFGFVGDSSIFRFLDLQILLEVILNRSHLQLSRGPWRRRLCATGDFWWFDLFMFVFLLTLWSQCSVFFSFLLLTTVMIFATRIENWISFAGYRKWVLWCGQMIFGGFCFWISHFHCLMFCFDKLNLD